MDDYLSEKEQIQAIRNWWKENGAFVIAGLVLGISGLTGWNFWQNYKLERAEAAGAVYSELVAAADRLDLDLASASLETLQSDYSSTPYLAQGRLMLEESSFEAGPLHVELTGQGVLGHVFAEGGGGGLPVRRK